MNVLVAGASGVIGREVVRCLAASGHSVRTLSQNPERAARQIAERAFAACGKAPRLMALPVWLMRLIAGLYRLANRRMADLLAFVIPASTRDCVAPAVGTRRLGPYFQEVAGRASADPAR